MATISAKRFAEVSAGFITSRSSPHTRKAYARDFATWVAFAEAEGENPARPSIGVAALYRDHLQERLETSSVARKLATLSAIYRFAIEQESPAASWNPFTQRALPRAAPPAFGKTEAVPEDTARRLLDSTLADDSEHGRRDAALIALLYSTGLRRVSVGTMRRANLLRRKGTLIARVVIKSGEQVEVEIPDEYARILYRWLEVAPRSPFVFPAARDTDRPMALALINRAITARADAIGAHVHPHCFRVSFVTGLYSAGVHERTIQAAVHHKDPRSTQRYDRGKRGAGATQALADYRKKKTPPSE